MDYNQRAYSRGAHLICQARLSRDSRAWRGVEVLDLSSGGMLMETAEDFAIGDTLWFRLHIQGFLSEFPAEIQGEIRRREPFGERFRYGVFFLNMDQDLKIRIDENVVGDRPIGGGAYSAH